MECEIEAAIEWRVQERALSSPVINGVSSSDIQAGLSSGSNAVPFLLTAKSIRDCRIHLHERRGNKIGESAYRRNPVLLCGDARSEGEFCR